MWFTLLAGILVIGSLRLTRMASLWDGYSINVDAVFIGLYILWMVVELRVSKRDVNTEGKKTSDAMTCQLYGTGQALTFLSALWFPSLWHSPNMAHLLGLCVFVTGVCYRLWAIRTLGQYYSHRVQTTADQKIVSSGPYRFTRHPAYAGMIAANAGICLYFLNWVTVCIFLLMLVPAILLRIRIEERTLFQVDGYADFASQRKRLFPGVW